MVGQYDGLETLRCELCNQVSKRRHAFTTPEGFILVCVNCRELFNPLRANTLFFDPQEKK